MRKLRTNKQQTAVQVPPVTAPVGGWNTVSPLSSMPVTDALFLDNFWPTAASVDVRKGWQVYGNVPEDDPGIDPHDIRTLLVYNDSDGSHKLFAADQTGIYDVTAGGEQLSASSVLTEGSCRYSNIRTGGGSYLWVCNGVDKSRIFDGTTWTELDGVSTPALTGITSTDVVNVTLFKSRLYLCLKDSLTFAYLGVDAIAGAASTFELGVIFKRGGYLVLIDSWTFDGGNGLDDVMVFMTSEGEIAIYQGYDPSNAATWALVGVYNVGEPLSYKSAVKFGGDLVLLTKRGLVPLSEALKDTELDPRKRLSYKIQPAVTSYVDIGKDLFGWETILYPSANMLLINVPYKYSETNNIVYSYQFVMNTMTRAWARFTNMPAECWCVMGDSLYFACHNIIYQAWTGYLDGTFPIIAKAKQAFHKLGVSSNNKYIQMIKPLVSQSGSLRISLGFDVDFRTDVSLQSGISYSSSVALWDTAKFDQDRWSGTTISSEWVTVENTPGMWFSLNFKVEARSNNISWLSTQYLVSRCGVI